MTISNRNSGFKEDLCDLCGLCLHKCPVLNLPLEEAKKEVKNLIEGKKSKYALQKCNTCFSCNLYCPQNANPYQLILERWNDLYKTRGAPPLYRFVCPTEVPNIWQMLNIFLDSKEKAWIHEWMNNEPNPNDNILLIGNYTHLFPFIIGGSKILDYFKPLDLIDQWEGGAYLYQGGYLEVVKKIAEQTKNDFDSWGVKKIVATLDAVEYIFNVVHDKEMKVSHEQSFQNLNHWLLENINSGTLELENKLDLTVTVHDNCYSKASGGAYWEDPREILEKCGCNIREMEHIKQDSLCCGFGAGASWVKNISIPFDIIFEGTKKFKEAEDTGASALITYCTGCYYLLWATKELIRSKLDVFHVIEITRMALGEKLNYPHDHVSRAWDIITIISYSLIQSMIKRNFFINKISYDVKRSTFRPKKFFLLRLMRLLFRVSLVRTLYAKLFQLLMPILKTR